MSNPIKELAEKYNIDEVFLKVPAKITKDDLDKLVDFHREERALWFAAQAEKGKEE